MAPRLPIWLCAVWAVVAVSHLPAPALTAATRTTAVALPDGKPYDIGKLQNVLHVYVDPAKGRDGSGRGSISQPLKSFTAAWSKVPARLTRPIHIHIQPGNITQAQVPEWIEEKNGAYPTPIVVEAVKHGTVTFNAFLALRFVKYIYFIGVNVSFQGNSDGMHPFHCEGCVGLLMKKVTVRGTVKEPYQTREVVKLNQCQGVYVESCDFAVSTDNAIDAVAVQYGHIINSHFHTVGFGVYVKGGSAYIIISGNRVHHTGELGIAAGFDTGFEWMVKPWIRYEAYDIKIINNVIHDIDDAPGIAVYGGHNVLVAHNTLYRVGKQSALFSIRQGLRTCDGDINERCTAYFKAGGWGPRGEPPDPWTQERLPNKNVMILNNLVVNPAGYTADRGAFYVPEPLPFCHEYSNDCSVILRPQGLPPLIPADQGLVIRGNLIVSNKEVNSDPLDPEVLGVTSDPGWDTGCRNNKTCPTCYPKQLVDQNAINSVGASLNNPASLDFRPKTGSLMGFKKLVFPMPAWGQWAGGLGTPPGNPANDVPTDRAGIARTATNNAPGAHVLF